MDECCDSAGRVAAAEEKAREAYEAKIEAMNRASQMSSLAQERLDEIIRMRRIVDGLLLAIAAIEEGRRHG